MEKLKKPIFLKKMGTLIYSGVSAVFGIVPSFIPGITKIKFFNITLNWYILIFTVFALIVVYILIYKHSINVFYNEYKKQFNEFLKIENNRDAILKDNNNLKINYEKMRKEKLELIYTLDTMFEDIRRGTINIKDSEKEYLESVLKTFYITKEHLNKILGGN